MKQIVAYDSLFTLGIDGEPQPWLITDWPKSDDGLAYTLKLRDDLVWNDGKNSPDEIKYYPLSLY